MNQKLFDDYEGCSNCRPDSPCHRHAGRNVNEINSWLDNLVQKYFTKPKPRNEYYSRDDWEPIQSIPGKVSEN